MFKLINNQWNGTACIQQTGEQIKIPMHMEYGIPNKIHFINMRLRNMHYIHIHEMK